MTRAEELRAASDKAAIELRLVECKLIGMSRCVAGLWKTKAPGLDFALGALAAVSVQQQTAQDALLAALEAETACARRDERGPALHRLRSRPGGSMIPFGWPSMCRKETCVWQEDDVRVPDEEPVSSVWLRFFGEAPNKEAALDKFDDEDTFGFLMPGNRVLEHSYQGSAIYCLDPVDYARVKSGVGIPPRVFPPEGQ